MSRLSFFSSVFKEKNEIMSAYWAKKDNQVNPKYGMSNVFTRYETKKIQETEKGVERKRRKRRT